MLNLILGRSGYGKTHTIFERIDSALNKAESNCIMLVPEQITFETEKQILKFMGAKKANSVKVYNFTRFAEAILRESNHQVGTLMNDGIRMLLLSEALENTKDRRKLFKDSKREQRNYGRMNAYLSILTELKQNNISVDSLEESVDVVSHEVLKDKLHDISLISNAFDALVAQSFVDTDDLFSKAIECISESSIVDNSDIYLDGFTGFTEQELKLLTCIIKKAPSVTISLCTDGMKEDTINQFTIANMTMNTLKNIAKENHVAISKPTYLQDNYRFRNEDLLHLEQNLFINKPDDYDCTNNISVISCADTYSECRMVTKKIREYLRNGGRCNDISIVCRNINNYKGILDILLAQEDIPYFMDVRDNILTDSLIEEIVCALEVVIHGWKTESVLRLLKTGMLGFSSHSISLLENYSFMWNIYGELWKKEWTASPDGFSVRVSSNANEKLYYLNILRRRLVKPLLELEEKLSDAITGEDFATAVYEYIIHSYSAFMVRFKIAKFESLGESILADRTERVWNIAMDLLNMFATTTKTKQTPERHLELFRLVCSFTDLGTIPETMDLIQIGSANRMRFANPKIVFVLGANEGVFPATPGIAGFFNDKERKRLVSAGINLQKSLDYSIAEELYFAYSATTAASEHLYISFQTASATDVLMPSELVHSVQKIFPNIKIESDKIDSENDIECTSEAFEYVAQTLSKPTPLTVSLMETFKLDPKTNMRLNKMVDGKVEAKQDFNDDSISAQLFNNLKLSPSRVEEYFKCPFKYFCDFGINIQDDGKAELNKIEFGNIVHYLMQVLVPEYEKIGYENVTYAKVRKDTKRIINDYVLEYMGGVENKPSRFKYLLSRLEKLGLETMWFVVQDMKQTMFVPTDYELNIGMDEQGIKPLTVELPDQSKVHIYGQIDRVDVFENDGIHYIRIVDYKTGTKEFKLHEVLEGINLQMLIYLSTIWKNGEDRYGKICPAGVLYLPTKLVVLDEEKMDVGDMNAIHDERTKEINMDGLILDDPDILKAMEIDGNGLFIPYQGKDKDKDHLATLEQFGALSSHIDDLICQMAETLKSGKVHSLPACTSEKDKPCVYCKYRAVCRREDNSPVREIVQRSKEEVFEIIKENSKNP